MEIINCSDYEEMSLLASRSVLADLRKSPAPLLCPASGKSAIGVFEKMAQSFQEEPGTFRELRILMLDEWYGLTPDDPNSCHSFLMKHVIRPLSVPGEHYFHFDSNAPDPVKECERMQATLGKQGPIDLCVLGLGMNGHLGFNEPAAALTPHCHLAQLSETSRTHAMISELARPPEFGLTLGMADVLQSKKIVLLLTGDAKGPVIEELLSKTISTQLPASLLWLHSKVECYLDRSSAIGL